MQDFRKLQVWKESKDLSVELYRILESFPKSETYGIVSQVRRASVSIPSNIAEGSSRTTSKDFSYFITISIGSVNELETLLIISLELGYLKKENYNVLSEKINSIKRKLINFKKSINKNV